MILHDELYFEITVKGNKAELKKFAKFIAADGLEDFIECCSDYINYGDEYATADDGDEADLILTNDDLGLEIDRFDVEEFLDVLCQAARNLEIVGHLYDINDDEYNFMSAEGSSSYKNLGAVDKFNDELDEAAESEEDGEID